MHRTGRLSRTGKATDPAGRFVEGIATAGTARPHSFAVIVARPRDHARWLPDEIGQGGVAALRAVKAELDPAGVMNPGKLV